MLLPYSWQSDFLRCSLLWFIGRQDKEDRRKAEKKEAAAAAKAENKLKNKQASDAKKWQQREKNHMKAAEMPQRERSHRLWHKGSVFYTKICLCFMTMYLLITRILFVLWHIIFCRTDAHLTRKRSNHSASRDKCPLIHHSSFKQNIAGCVSCALFVVPVFFFDRCVFCNLRCTLQWGLAGKHICLSDEASNSVARCCNIINTSTIELEN